MLKRLLSDESGATAVEYGLLTAIMAVALLSGFAAFGSALNTQFQHLAGIINY
jgi:pilus assembly protein Flp/PilA